MHPGVPPGIKPHEISGGSHLLSAPTVSLSLDFFPFILWKALYPRGLKTGGGVTGYTEEIHENAPQMGRAIAGRWQVSRRLRLRPGHPPGSHNRTQGPATWLLATAPWA